MRAELDVKSFRDLIVWNRAIEVCVAVYELTKGFPREEIYGLTSQLRRASVSVPSNIAEGSGRNSTGEFIQFLGIARGSNYEIQTQLHISRSLGFGDEAPRVKCERLSNEVERMLNGLIAKLSA